MEFNNNRYILEDVIHGNNKAYEQLIQCYFVELVLFSTRIIKDEEQAKDIVHDVFLNIWKNRNDLNPQINIKAYLYRSVKNLSINFLKSKKIRTDFVQDFESLHQHEFQDESSLYIDRELENKIMALIAELPEKCREAFTLNRLKGLKYKEVADIMNISQKMVEAHISKALTFLRQSLKSYVNFIIFIIANIGFFCFQLFLL